MKRLSTFKGIMLATALMTMGMMHSSEAATSAQALQEASQMRLSKITDLKKDTRVFKLAPQIETKMVWFENRYGFKLAGHMYLPQNFDVQKKYQGIVISGPFGAVKEQVAGLYAQEMAKAGYVVVTFDPSTTGESSGTHRNMGSPEIFTEDYSAAVDFISNLKFVDSDKIGAIGICGLSGMALTAASNDVRIKAVAVSALYDMSESISDHYLGAYYTDKQRQAVKEHIAYMRDVEAKYGKGITGSHELGVDEKGKVMTFPTMFPDKLPEGTNEVVQGFYDYYVTRAYHSRSINSNTLAWDATTPYGFFNFSLMENIEEISPRPVMIITGDKAHSKYFSDKVYARLKNPKEMIVVPGATHTDLYDQMDKIPFAKLVGFFDENLK